MTCLDISLKGKLMMILESAGVVKEKPIVKKDREFKSKLVNDLIANIAEKYIPYTVQSYLKEAAKQAYKIDHLFNVNFYIGYMVFDLSILKNEQKLILKYVVLSTSLVPW